MDVKTLYQELLKQGKDPKSAAREAQERTGFSVVTGRPIKAQLQFTKDSTYYGEYRYTNT